MTKQIQVEYSLYQMYGCSQTITLEIDIDEYNAWKEQDILDEKLYDIALNNLTEVIGISITKPKD